MSESASWIVGLMRENYEAIGFIPEPTIQRQYLNLDRYVVQQDERGRRVGYLLHGALRYGRPVSIAQHCIQYDDRLRGYGEQAFHVFLDRAERAGVAAIALRCAVDLPSLLFWQDQGFMLRSIVPGGQARQRSIARLVLPLYPLLRVEPPSDAPAIATAADVREL